MKKLLWVFAALVLLGGALFVVGLRPSTIAAWVDGVLLENEAVVAVVRQVNGWFGRETGGSGSVDADTVQSVNLIDEAQIAHELVAGIRNFQTTVTIPLASPYADVEGEAMSRYMLSQVEHAFAVIRKEYPEIFWMSLGTYDLQWESIAGDPHVTLYLQMKYCHTRSTAMLIEQRIETVVDEIVRTAPADPAQAVRHFHDWIVNNTVYDSAVVENDSMEGFEYAFNIDGVFLDGSAVCEGYTKAFKLLCDRAGIPCVIVFGVADGENHGWNYVRLDGQWYLVDCTWDDPVSSVDLLIWDHFLKGSQSLIGAQRVADIYHNDNAAYPLLAQFDYGTAGGETGDIWVDANLSPLYEDGPNTLRAGLVGRFEAGGGKAPYAYRLTAEQPDNAAFLLDGESGELSVVADRLPRGSYTIELEVRDSGGETATVSYVLTVEAPLEALELQETTDQRGWVA